MPPQPTSDRRLAIVHTATELFARDGYSAVGMRSIADAVGVRPSSLYHHFPSKVDLLHAVCLVATESFISAQLPALRTDASPTLRLVGVLREHVRYFHEHRLEETVGRRELTTLREQAPELHEDVQQHRRAYQHAIQAVVEEGVAAGEFVVDDPHLATLAVLGLVNSITTWFVPGGPSTIAEVGDAYVDMAIGRILGGDLTARPASRPRRARGSRA